MSTTLLTKRLRTLERDGVVSSVAAPSERGRRYYLTPQGQELAEVVLHLGTWGARWLEVTPREQDPFIALWSWTRMVDVDALGERLFGCLLGGMELLTVQLGVQTGLFAALRDGGPATAGELAGGPGLRSATPGNGWSSRPPRVSWR